MQQRVFGHTGNARRNILSLWLLVGWVIGLQDVRSLHAARFVDRTATLGLSGLGNGAACWIDFNNDGWVDLYADGILWRNNSGTSFTAINLGIGSPYAVWGDFNNDGYPDLFSMGNYKMYRNNGGTGSMTQLTTPTLPMDSCYGASFADHNNDGFIDLYVGGYENPNYLPDAILRNNAGTSFTMTQPEPTGALKPGRGITSCDFDEDGDQDIYVSNYRLEANYLWINNGSGTFTDVAATYGVAGIYDGWSYSYGHTIGSCWGDLDNDGHFDLFVGNFSHSWGFPHQDTTRFYRNLGPGGSWHFQDKSSTAGLAWQESYASPTLGDFDNDGDVDFYFTTVYPTATTGEPNYPVLYRNNGNWTFTDVTATEGLSYLPATYQAAWADFNHDGKLDLVTAGKLFVNTGAANHWLGVRLRSDGTVVNRSAIGTQVRITLGNQTLTRHVEAGTSQGNENDFLLHFGLGNTVGPVNVAIRWPDRTTTTVSSAVDRILVVDRPPCLQVTPADNFTAAGPQGGPFSPAGKTYTLTNTANRAISWTAAASPSWLSVSPASGTLAIGASAGVTASFNAAANALTASPNAYSGTLTFTNTTNGSGTTSRSVSLTVNPPPMLQVSPADNVTAAGPQGGPFSPASRTYTLTNISGQPLEWEVVPTQGWIQLSSYWGILAAGDNVTLTASFATSADSLTASPTSYSAILVFTNLTDGSTAAERTVSLTVQPVLRGTLVLGDYTASPAGLACAVQLWQSGSLYRADYVTLDGQGTFRMTDVAAGAYTVKILAWNWLFRTIPNVAVTATVTDLGTVPLINGDIDTDNAVTADDLYYLLAGVEYDDTWPDLDGDGAATSTDLAIGLKNLGRVGDP